MEVRFQSARLEELEPGESGDGGFPPALARAFRKRMQFIRSALDERDFYSMRSLRFEKLKGQRTHQHSMRLNDQYRLILELEGKGPTKTVVVVGIEDYH